jgi:hypothetical protein
MPIETPAQCILNQMARLFPDAIFYKETTQRVVALTFDDAPTPNDPGDRSTQWILDAIADYNRTLDDPAFRARATFFIITSHLNPDSTILEQIQAEGHEIANHGTVDEKASLLHWDAIINQADLILHLCILKSRSQQYRRKVQNWWLFRNQN